MALTIGVSRHFPLLAIDVQGVESGLKVWSGQSVSVLESWQTLVASTPHDPNVRFSESSLQSGEAPYRISFSPQDMFDAYAIIVL